MSIKNDIEMVKEELTSEEKFFEKSVITERFIKKYKSVMIGGAIAVIILVAGNIAYDANKESTAVAANDALNELRVDSKNKDALSQLEILSPTLYEAYTYSVAVTNNDTATLEKLSASKSTLISDLVDYELAKDTKTLENYTLKQGAIYKDLAQVQSAIMLIDSGNTKSGHEKLALISDTSSLSRVAKALSHYGVK